MYHGGPDSICMLDILRKLKGNLNFEIYVAHINHMIREEADEETEYVKEFCEELGIECYIKRIDVIKIANNLKRGKDRNRLSAGWNKGRYDQGQEGTQGFLF